MLRSAASATVPAGSGLAFQVDGLFDDDQGLDDADLEIGWRATTP